MNRTLARTFLLGLVLLGAAAARAETPPANPAAAAKTEPGGPGCFVQLHEAAYAPTRHQETRALMAFERLGCRDALARKFPAGVVPRTPHSPEALAWLLYMRLKHPSPAR